MSNELRIPQAIASRPDLTATAKLVYGVIKDMNGDHAATYDHIAEMVGCCQRGAFESVNRLELAKMIRVERSHKSANKYFLT